MVFTVCKDIMTGAVDRTPMQVLGFFAQLSFGGPALGFLLGEAAVQLLGYIMNDPASEVTLVMSSTYACYLLAEGTSFVVSGVLAVVLLGLRMSAGGKVRISCEPAMHYFWETVGYLANTVIFILAGVLIVEKAFLKARARAGLAGERPAAR